jgi:hypothetical protein
MSRLLSFDGSSHACEKMASTLCNFCQKEPEMDLDRFTEQSQEALRAKVTAAQQSKTEGLFNATRSRTPEVNYG